MTSYDNSSPSFNKKDIDQTQTQAQDPNNNHIRVNIRPIFMSTMGNWDKENRMYSKILPSEELKQCKSTCDAFFSIEKPSDVNNITKINKTVCNQYCEQLYSQYEQDSEAILAIKKYCTIDGSYELCLAKNKANIFNEIKNLCGTDEPCNLYNNDIADHILSKYKLEDKTIGRYKFSKRENFKSGENNRMNKLVTPVLVIILVSCIIGVMFILK
jgi:hypothetical protein